MRLALLCLILCFVLALPAYSNDAYTRGHTRKDGTYVSPNYRSSPNRTALDNGGVRTIAVTAHTPVTKVRSSGALVFGPGAELQEQASPASPIVFTPST